MATSILLAKIWSESFIGIGTVPNAGSWRPEGLGVPDFGGLPACWGDSALMISKPGQQTSGTYGSMGSRARAGVLIAIPSGVSGSRTPRDSPKFRQHLPPSRTGMGDGSQGP